MGDLYNPFPKLPKNIRQLGDTDQVVRLYVEDYVNTYLKRLYPAGKQTLRVGLLLGSVEQYDGTPYIFVDGAMEFEDVETDGEKLLFSESAWKKAYQGMEESFPKRTIQGWFLCGSPASQLSPLNYWKQHSQYFAGKNQLMYLNHGLEGEEAVYVTSEDGFYRLKGHCIYYERNQMMQDYMITRKDVRRVESGSHEKVIKDFRQRMNLRREQADTGRHTAGALGVACGVLTVAVMAGGVVLVNNYQKMRQMETVLTSVLPADVSDWDEYRSGKAAEPDFIIEELPGRVYPTETAVGETGETYRAGEEGGTAGQPGAGTTGQSGAGNSGAGTTGQSGVGNSEAGESGNPEGENLGTGPLGADAAGQPGAGNSAAGTPAADPSSQSAAGTSAAQGPQTSDSAPEASSGEAAPADGVVEEAVPEPESQGFAGMGKGEGEGDAADAARPPIDYGAAAANGYKIYEIGEGETLYGICWKEYGDLKRLTEICSLNALTDEDHILAGQKLILP